MPDETTTTVVEATTTETGAEQLGDAGKQALDRMKVERDEARRDARRVKDLEAELDKARTANATEAEKAILAAKAEGATEANQKANERILRAEVRALAGKFADPTDALNFVDLTDFKVTDTGDVDTKAITKALDAVLAEKPYLAADTGPRVPGVPTGARQASGGPDMNTLLRQAAGRA